MNDNGDSSNYNSIQLAIRRRIERGLVFGVNYTFSRALDTGGIPDPDMLIRTGDEIRISNFLVWQIAYTEIYMTPSLWPDFRKEEYLRALEEYQKRERRFGATGEQVADIQSRILE